MSVGVAGVVACQVISVRASAPGCDGPAEKGPADGPRNPGAVRAPIASAIAVATAIATAIAMRAVPSAAVPAAAHMASVEAARAAIAMVVPTAATDWCPWHFTTRGKRRDYRD